MQLSLIFYGLIFIIFILGITIILIVMNLSKLLHGLEGSKADGKDKSLILDEASKKAVKIIDDANNKALDIVQKSNLFANSSHDSFNNQLKNVTSMQIKAFEKATAEFIQLYSNVLTDLKSKNIEVFQNVSKNIESSTLEEVRKFKSIIEKETISSENLLNQKIDAEYAVAKKNIDIYKQNQLKMIEDNIYELLEKVTTILLGKAIKTSEQEELITKALDQAKKDGIFSNAK